MLDFEKDEFEGIGKVSLIDKQHAKQTHYSGLIVLLLPLIAIVEMIVLLYLKYHNHNIQFFFDNLFIITLLHSLPLIVNILVGWSIWRKSKNKSPFVYTNSRQALNFQISITLYLIISLMLVILIIGIFLIFAIILFDISCIADAIKKTGKGETYSYPLSIHFVS